MFSIAYNKPALIYRRFVQHFAALPLKFLACTKLTVSFGDEKFVFVSFYNMIYNVMKTYL